jgi:outer membrane protein OmpA-like peptidoglycan-associated protein
MNKTSLRVVAGLTLLAFVLSAGCDTLRGAMQKRTTQGALIGTAVGAGAGALIDRGKPGRGALIGAGAGAAVGAGIGYYLDRQKRELEKVPGAEVRVEEKDGTQQLVLTMTSSLLFETNSFDISRGRDSLDQIAETLNKYPESRVVVKGYTDSRGTEDYNLQLSQRRADAVKNYLIAKQVNPARITAVGFGESLPVASNDTEEGRQKNRRVEIEIVPTGAGSA